MNPTITLESQLDTLRKGRRRDYLIASSVIVLFGLLIWSGSVLLPELTQLGSDDALKNTSRFINELTPLPVRETPAISVFLEWAGGMLAENGWHAMLVTFGIATLGITLAGAIATPLSTIAARNIASESPAGVPLGARSNLIALLWQSCRWVARAIFILTRAIPEYIYAFLLLSIFGPNLWPLILALAIHNVGILGRLGTEVIENFPDNAAAPLLTTGSKRSQVIISTILPQSLNRLLVYFFYRWETCVREATVLGLVGIPSLGLLIDQARARMFYDEMFFYVMLGAALVLVGDIASNVIRSKIRNST